MAAGGGEHRHRRQSKWRQRLLFVVEEKTLDRLCLTYFVFKMNLKDMFASTENEDPEEDWTAMRDFPRPIAQFETLPHRPERLDLAVVPGNNNGGTNIVAVSADRRTIIHDIAAAAEQPSPRPALRYAMPDGIALIPLGS